MEPEKLLFNANKVLTTLTKVRGSIPSLDGERTTLLPWPLHFDRDREVLGHLASIGITPRKDLEAKAWKIPYGRYLELEGLEPLDIVDIRAARDCVEVGRLILLSSRPRRIAVYWDPSNPPPEMVPTHSADAKAIDALAQRRDAHYSFEGTLDQTLLKLPAYLGPTVLGELKMFTGQTIDAKERRELFGVGADAKGMASRIVISTGSRPDYDKIVQVTLQNLGMVLPVEPWVQRIREVSMQHHQSKNNAESRARLGF